MAIIKKKEFAKMDNTQLKERRDEFKLELSRELAGSEVGGSVKSPGRIKELRKTIARIEQKLAIIKHKSETKQKPEKKEVK